ncbi:hypothetical protein ACH5RR_022601 [Cinchona calisaya]|uniref:F-box domain-containing protein n=1 Tax=Cinchona calisaya TaxID=153742 RepID=A0ABD2Z8A2_9GENT
MVTTSKRGRKGRSRGLPNNSNRRVFPDELLWEILLRLPIKSLMKFKCVSKLWRSIILNPLFANAYRCGFRGILVCDPFDTPRLSPAKNFFYISFDGLISHHVTVEHGRRMGSTDVVNGLVCFFYANYSCLYNIATRQSMDLPLSVYEGASAGYHLGFDPVNKLYKLLKTCAIYDKYLDGGELDGEIDCVNMVTNLNCEILTIGVDKSWRSIDPPPWEIIHRSLCINGALYWAVSREKPDGFSDHLIAFHLSEEKFQFGIPKPDEPNGERRHYRMPQFAPKLALFTSSAEIRNGTTYIDSWIICNSDGDGDWEADHNFDIPASNYDHYNFIPGGVLPDGKVVIWDTYGTMSGMDFLIPFYLYDPVEKKLTKMVIRKCRSKSSSKIFRQHYITGFLSYHEENIISLYAI